MVDAPGPQVFLRREVVAALAPLGPLLTYTWSYIEPGPQVIAARVAPAVVRS